MKENKNQRSTDPSYKRIVAFIFYEIQLRCFTYE